MVDLDKLDNVIEDLEISSKSIMEISDVIKNVEDISELTNNNVQALVELIHQLDELSKNNVHINQLCENATKTIEKYCTKSSEQNTKFISTVNTLLLQIKNENHSLYREFEGTITSRFDLFKSDTLVENRKITDDIQNRFNQKIDIGITDVKNSMDNNSSKLKNNIESVSTQISCDIQSARNNTNKNIDAFSAQLNNKLDKKLLLVTILFSCSLGVSIIAIIMNLVRAF